MSSLIVKNIASEKRTWNAGGKRSFQRYARGVLVLRHVPGWNDLKSLSIAEKNADRENFRDLNHLRVDNGRNLSVQP